MLISDLIERLEDIKKVHGDVDVEIADWYERYSAPHPVENVEFQSYRVVIDV